MALSSMAVPAKRGVWRLMTLTDGTEVRVQLVGDEFMHYYVSEDGTSMSWMQQQDREIDWILLLPCLA